MKTATPEYERWPLIADSAAIHPPRSKPLRGRGYVQTHEGYSMTPQRGNPDIGISRARFNTTLEQLFEPGESDLLTVTLPLVHGPECRISPAREDARLTLAGAGKRALSDGAYIPMRPASFNPNLQRIAILPWRLCFVSQVRGP